MLRTFGILNGLDVLSDVGCVNQGPKVVGASVIVTDLDFVESCGCCQYIEG